MMTRALVSIRQRLDGLGIVLSGLCVVHCLLGLLVVSALGVGGGMLLSPAIHEAGLLLAILIGIATLGLGALRHGDRGPLALGACGVALMALAVATGHGPAEAMLTIAGVALVATAHMRNLRRAG